MAVLPVSADFSHLKKQAKDLLREARGGDLPALERFVAGLPAVRGVALTELAGRELRLHDAQSVVAREYGFASWTELKRYVEWKREEGDSAARGEKLKSWFGWAYEGNRRERRLAVRMLAEEPKFFAGDVWVGLAVGDVSLVAKAVREPGWVNRAGGYWPENAGMPPLLAVAHSRLIQGEGFEAGLLACAALLIKAGADVNARYTHPEWTDSPFSAVYGAAGRTHHAGMARLLLEAGADPNDNESLYHSVEAREPECMDLLLEHGVRVTGTNALGRVLDFDRLEWLRKLLAHGGDAKERPWLHQAILRGRSIAHVRLLVEAGADLQAVNREGVSLCRYAEVHGRKDVVELLKAAGVQEELTLEDRFVAACAAADLELARALAAELGDVFSRLNQRQLHAMPELAEVGNLAAVRTMLAVGWPREVKAGWGATALNLAVFNGDAAMAELLLKNRADWRTLHRYKNNVLGTLSWASQAEDVEGPADGRAQDYVACARVLVEAGVPLPGEEYSFSEEVGGYFDAVRLNKSATYPGKADSPPE